MAIQKDTEIIGKIGNLIYYKWMDRYCIRTAPTSVQQSAATKRAATNFGKASSRSKVIRQHLNRLIAYPRHKEMQKRLRKALLASIDFADSGTGEMLSHPLKGFRFNEALSLEHCLGFQLQVTSKIEGVFQVEIPAINPFNVIKVPPGTSRIQLELQAISYSFDHDESYSGTPIILNVPYTDITQAPVSTGVETFYKKPGTVLLAGALTYWQKDVRLNAPGYHPAEVVGITY